MTSFAPPPGRTTTRDGYYDNVRFPRPMKLALFSDVHADIASFYHNNHRSNPIYIKHQIHAVRPFLVRTKNAYYACAPPVLSFPSQAPLPSRHGPGTIASSWDVKIRKTRRFAQVGVTSNRSSGTALDDGPGAAEGTISLSSVDVAGELQRGTVIDDGSGTVEGARSVSSLAAGDPKAESQ